MGIKELILRLESVPTSVPRSADVVELEQRETRAELEFERRKHELREVLKRRQSVKPPRG